MSVIADPLTPSRAQIDIVLIDDHAIVRQGLRAVLERADDIRVVGEAATTDATLAIVGEARPQIVLLDLKLSSGSHTEGLDLCSALMAGHPELGVLVLTTFVDDHLVFGRHPQRRTDLEHRAPLRDQLSHRRRTGGGRRSRGSRSMRAPE